MRYERVNFRLYRMVCCGHLLCWVNPRPPTFCPECGANVYPEVRGWALHVDDEAVIQYSREDPGT